MDHLYLSMIVFLKNNNQIDHKKTALLIKKELEKGVTNFFVDQYYYNKCNFSNSNFFDFYKKVAKLLPQNSNLIIDMSSDMLGRVEVLMSKLENKKEKIFYSLNLTTELLEEYRNESEHILNILDQNSNKIYFKIIPQALENKEFEKLVANNKIKGLIVETDYDPDFDIKIPENIKSCQTNLEIIYKADDLYLVALKNNNSILSNYAGILTADFSTIYNNFRNKRYEEALQSQEFLNEKLNLLEKYNYFKVVNYYFNQIEKLNSASFNNLKLNSEEKIELRDILTIY